MYVKIATHSPAAQKIAEILRPLSSSGRVAHCMERVEAALHDAGIRFIPAYGENDTIVVHVGSERLEIGWTGSKQNCLITGRSISLAR